MTWLAPKVSLPAGGRIRTVGRCDQRAYWRAYYHAKRKPRKQEYTAAQAERRRVKQREYYWQNVDQSRATARAAYWRKKAKS